MRKPLVSVLALAVSLMLIACGGDDGDGGEDKAGSDIAAAEKAIGTYARESLGTPKRTTCESNGSDGWDCEIKLADGSSALCSLSGDPDQPSQISCSRF